MDSLLTKLIRVRSRGSFARNRNVASSQPPLHVRDGNALEPARRCPRQMDLFPFLIFPFLFLVCGSKEVGWLVGRGGGWAGGSPLTDEISAASVSTGGCAVALLSCSISTSNSLILAYIAAPRPS